MRRRAASPGTARGRRYDLPLEQGAGNGFLVTLVGLMTCLAFLSLVAMFGLSALTERWSSGLAGQMTVEIPAIAAGGAARPRAEITAVTARIAGLLRREPAAAGVHPLDDAEIAALVQPWLGDNLAGFADLPVPGLVSFRMGAVDAGTIAALRTKIAAVDPQARLSTYESWLGDIVRAAAALRFVAALLVIVVGAVGAVAVAGAAQARLSVSRETIESLHLMGAADAYISRQFRRHAVRLAFAGACCGLLGGGAILAVARLVAGSRGDLSLPAFILAPWQAGALCALPACAALLAAIAAQATVRRALGRMP